MTDGSIFKTPHKHRYLYVKKNGPMMRLLRKPIYYTEDDEKADKSPFVYTDDPYIGGLYYMSLLGFLHGLFGVTIVYDEPDEYRISDI